MRSTPQNTSTNYYPFGSAISSRAFASGGYRFGFNEMERDDEVKGAGNSYTTEFRQYDPRIGKWLSIDPKMMKYPSWSPHSSFFNNPIFFEDPFGDDPPKRLSFGVRVDNYMKGNAFLNRANKFARANNIDEKDIKTYSNVVIISRLHFHTTIELDDDGVSHMTGHIDVETIRFEYGGERWASRISSRINNFMKKDPIKAGKVNTGVGSTPHSIAKGIAGINPLWSVPNNVSVLYAEKELDRTEAATGADKVFAGFGLISPVNPGKSLMKVQMKKQAKKGMLTEVKKNALEKRGNIIDVGHNFIHFLKDAGVIGLQNNEALKSDEH